ncbi:hypothetical protein CsatB_007626 [Cannabis sativa]|uniref:PWWP domain-containing protein n=1 Tax=Cannabis sativa TaxID=3483 RepID=A0A7J6ENU3_CANSA|nr:uncharacterized protein LOC115714667 [Cannabis sativa]KAF4360117.1 hypothetical protein F8388_015986 [Cannabis sativa]
MKSKDLANGKDHVSKESTKGVAVNQCGIMVRINPLDIIWVKNRRGSWWPGQVVDENLISETSKPGSRSAGEVLVRLYGTYTYLYVDPTKYFSEFDAVLKQNNNSHGKIFLKALELEVAGLKAGESKKRKAKSEDKSRTKHCDGDNSRKNLTRNSKSSTESKKRNREKQNSTRKNSEKSLEKTSKSIPKPDETLSKKRKLARSSPDTPPAKSQELSARRIKVMQSLGLAAPPGSPFCRHGQLFT